MTAALHLATSNPRPLQVGDRVKPSPEWQLRYTDCYLWHWRPGAAWTGRIAAFFTDKAGTRRAVVRHEPEDCGCNWKPDCWRCEGTGTTTKRALPLAEIEST